MKTYKEKKDFIDLREAMYHICNAIDHVKDDSAVPDCIKYDLFMFRTQIQIIVKNIGYAIEDLKSAIFYKDDDNAFLSLIDCYTETESYEKAIKLIEQRKEKSKLMDDQSKFSLYNKKESKIKERQKALFEKLEKLSIFKNIGDNHKLKLYDELTKRGIRLRPQIHNIPANCEANIYIDDHGHYHFPILVIYEEFNTTDYIQDMDENAFVSDILEMLLAERLPWDKELKYNLNNSICFYEMSDLDTVLKKEKNFYYPLRNDDRLMDVLKNKRVFMNGFPVITVLSQNTKFYHHFIKNKIILKRK